VSALSGPALLCPSRIQCDNKLSPVCSLLVQNHLLCSAVPCSIAPSLKQLKSSLGCRSHPNVQNLEGMLPIWRSSSSLSEITNSILGKPLPTLPFFTLCFVCTLWPITVGTTCKVTQCRVCLAAWLLFCLCLNAESLRLRQRQHRQVMAQPQVACKT